MPIEASIQRIRVEIDGVTVADSEQPVLLHETGLPVRYYLPPSDIRMDVLVPTETSTTCHWKGQARYWSAAIDGKVHTDIAWGYDHPLVEAEAIAGLVSFYNEKVDVYLDEVLEERPVTMFG
jgi:uncharacterized protein (DUF427 family)